MVIVKSSSLLKLEMCEETQFTLACFKLIYLKEFKKVKKFDLKLIHTLLLIQVTLMKFITEEHTVAWNRIFSPSCFDCFHFCSFSYAEDLYVATQP